jgi:hypothetical protein
MNYADPIKIKGMFLFWVKESGPTAVPGEYEAVLKVGDDSVSTKFQLVMDPRVEASQEDLQAQFDFLIITRDKLSELHQTIKDIRSTRKQLKELSEKLGEEFKEIETESKRIDSLMTIIEEAFYQTKNKSEQDILNYPIQLNNKLGTLSSMASIGYNRPTKQMYELKDDLFIEIDVHLKNWNIIKEVDIKKLNKMVYDASIDAISLPE